MPKIYNPPPAVTATFVTTGDEPSLTGETTLGALFSSGVAASRPAFGTAGRMYYATDTHILSLDTGTAWVNVGTLDHADLLDFPTHAAPTHASLSGVTSEQHQPRTEHKIGTAGGASEVLTFGTAFASTPTCAVGSNAVDTYASARSTTSVTVASGDQTAGKPRMAICGVAT